MAGQDPDDHDDEQSPSSAPWYNRTPAVIGASVVGLAVVGILIAAVTFVSRQFNEPEQAPLNYVEPSFSATATGSSSTPTTTATITSTSPPVTTDINGPSSTTSSSSDTSSSTDTSTRTAWTKPYTPPSGDESAPTTTQRGPRTNVTRTLYPQP
jgi:cytoskeletal protein RodZ